MVHRNRNPYNIAVVAFAAMGAIAFGYASTVIGSTLAQPSFIDYFNLNERSDEDAIKGTMNAMFTVGGLIGALGCSYVAEWLGRKKAVLTSCVIMVLGGGLQSGSVQAGMFIFSRFLTGVGVGAVLCLTPLYQSEVSPPHSRGLMVGLHGIGCTVGYCIGGWVGYAFYFVRAGGTQWRIPLAIQAIPPLILGTGILFLPESPRWLISRGQPEKALKIVQRLHRDENDPQNTFAYREYQQILKQYEIDKDRSVSWKTMFTMPSYRKRWAIGFLVMFGSQTTGTIVINNYGPALYGSLGFDTAYQLMLTACWITLSVVGNVFNAFTLDWLGRVRAIQIGWIGCGLALIGECVALSTYERTGSRPSAIASVAFLFVHIFAFSFNIDATSYVYTSEIFPSHIRAKGMSGSIAGYWIAQIVYLQVSPTAFSEVGWKFYLVFLIGIFAFVIPTFWYFPETKGVPLEQISALFGDEAVDFGLYGSDEGSDTPKEEKS